METAMMSHRAPSKQNLGRTQRAKILAENLFFCCFSVFFNHVIGSMAYNTELLNQLGAGTQAEIAKFTRIRNWAICVTGIALAVGCSTTWVSPLTGCIAFSIAALGVIVAVVANLAARNLEKKIQPQKILGNYVVNLEIFEAYNRKLLEFDLSTAMTKVCSALEIDWQFYADIFAFEENATLGDFMGRQQRTWNVILTKKGPKATMFPCVDSEKVIALLTRAQLPIVYMCEAKNERGKMVFMFCEVSDGFSRIYRYLSVVICAKNDFDEAQTTIRRSGYSLLQEIEEAEMIPGGVCLRAFDYPIFFFECAQKRPLIDTE
jgi:hypothetical protein